jgi:hypothetical protein
MATPKSVYLIANYAARPKNRKMTHIKGYMADPANIAWDESVTITVGLKNKDLLNSRIVLNINEQKVERNTFGENKSFMELFEYFYTASPKEISQALQKVGISIGKKDEPVNVQEDVRSEEEAPAQPGPAAATDLVGAS